MVTLPQTNYLKQAAILLALLGLGAGTVALSGCSTSSANQPALQLGLPLQCELNKTCWVVNYMDMDPGKEYKDVGCGRRTYDGHKGTDFGVLDVRAVDQGVKVYASAAGKVLGVRDGMTDRMIEDLADKERIKGKECGNGVVLDHGDGWQTQYCHMKKGSIKVTKDATVEKGQLLGEVGLSGATEFPHLHLSLRHNGKPVDPFLNSVSDGTCQTKPDLSHSMWDADLHDQLAYQPVIIQSVGLAHTPPDLLDIRYGNYKDGFVKSTTPQLLVWAYLFGTKPGDNLSFLITDSRNKTWLSAKQTLTSHKAAYLQYVGKKHQPNEQWTPGTYWVNVTLERDGEKHTKEWAFQLQ